MADLQGKGVPTTSTVGNVDDYYTDQLTGLRYQLTRIVSRERYKSEVDEYTWELLPPWQQRGQTGATGEDGGYYTPSVDSDGNLTWTPSDESMPSVPSSNIKGPQGSPGPAGATADAVMMITITGTTCSKSSTEIYNALKAGKIVYCIATLDASPDGYTGELVCYPSYPFSADRITLFSIGELPQNTGGKLSYRILYVEGTTVSVHDRGTIWNHEPPEETETT